MQVGEFALFYLLFANGFAAFIAKNAKSVKDEIIKIGRFVSFSRNVSLKSGMNKSCRTMRITHWEKGYANNLRVE